MARKMLLNFAALLLLVGCATPDNFSMYPQALKENENVNSQMAVALVGNAGPTTIDYVQFMHSSLPAINVRGIKIPPGTIIAVPIPVGLKDLSLNVYTIEGRGGGYLPSGMSFGYIPVRTPKIDISSRGLYYIATIGQGENYTATPDLAMLARFKKANPQLAALRPINFSWPR